MNMLRSLVPRSSCHRLLAMGILGMAVVSLWYFVEQGVFFLSHQLRSRPNSNVAERSAEFAAFFAEADAIRVFGTDVLGLRPTDSYTRFVHTEKNHVAMVVSAVRPGSFERKLWRFPVVGSLPYRGFYREAAATREAARLEARGWETLVRRVGAFSSLGHFSDPLYSYMANYHAERLASMILHEMTHATVWFADDAPLNEAIATFVGHAGAMAYLEHRFGIESEVYLEAVRRQAERETFTLFMRDLARRLEDLYTSGAPVADVLATKDSIIAEERERFVENYDHWFADGSYLSFLHRNINNAYIDLFRTYNADLDLISLLHLSRDGNLVDLVATATALQSDPDPRRAIERALL